MTNRTASTNRETLSDAQYEAGRIDAPLPETLDRLAQIRKDNKIIAARCNLLNVDVRFYTRNFRKVGGLMTADEQAALDAAKAEYAAGCLARQYLNNAEIDRPLFFAAGDVDEAGAGDGQVLEEIF